MASELEYIIDVEGLTKRFGRRTVVNALSMRVRRGEIYGFLGPNGSGKTTFIRMLCGLLRPDAGSGTCLGHDIITESDLIKPQVGYMAQRFSLYEDLSVDENLRFVAKVYGLRDIAEAVAAIIDQMGLGRFRNQLAGSLSGGWKQRLALASCLIHSPKVLLLDEPTAGVDPKARRDFWDEIHRLAGEGMTALISTHYMDEAERCHRLAYIAYGDLLAKGTAEELIAMERLSTWAVTGPDLARVASELRGRPGVEQVVAFGNTLHVSGHDASSVAGAVSALGPGYRTEETSTGLEEVFISLMTRQGVAAGGGPDAEPGNRMHA